MSHAAGPPARFPTTLVVATASIALLSAELAFFAPPWLREEMLRGTAVVLLVFIVVLVARYMLLLWLGYLHHVESVMADRRRDPEDDYCPPVSVLVPAYNEGVCIEPAIRALLRMDYPAYEVIVLEY